MEKKKKNRKESWKDIYASALAVSQAVVLAPHRSAALWELYKLDGT